MRRKTDYERGVAPEQAAKNSARKPVKWGKRVVTIMTDEERESKEEERPPRLLKVGSSYEVIYDDASDDAAAKQKAKEEQAEREHQSMIDSFEAIIQDWSDFYKTYKNLVPNDNRAEALELFRIVRQERE